MPINQTLKTGRPKSRSNYVETVHQLERLVGSLAPGDRVPTHTELMARLGVSERAVLRALSDLQQRGRIVRRNGVGTFVADHDAAGSANSLLSIRPPVKQRPVVVITVPGMTFFDRCMDVLFRHAEMGDLSLVCQMVDRNAPVYELPVRAEEGPLGFVLFHYDLAPLARQLQEKGCRVALVGAPPHEVIPDFPCIYSDHEQGGYLAARHLIDLGHRRIAFTPIDKRTLRWQGYGRAVQEAKRLGVELEIIPLSSKASQMNNEDEAWLSAQEITEAFLSQNPRPTGIVCWNDHEGASLVGELGRVGVRVPDDVSLVGYDDLPEGRLVVPHLTTIDQAIDRQLRAALDLVSHPTAAPPPRHTVIVLPTLVQRESTAAPPSPHHRL